MLSTALLREIKSGGAADAVVLMPGTTSRPFRGQLRATGTSPFTLLIDGRRATVPSLKVVGTFTGDMPYTVSMLVLDDSVAPWILRSESPRNADWRGIVQLVRVETRVRTDELANALRDDTATVRNIYFATGSDAVDDVLAGDRGDRGRAEGESIVARYDRGTHRQHWREGSEPGSSPQRRAARVVTVPVKNTGSRRHA
jgi:hypothetical protein